MEVRLLSSKSIIFQFLSKRGKCPFSYIETSTYSIILWELINQSHTDNSYGSNLYIFINTLEISLPLGYSLLSIIVVILGYLIVITIFENLKSDLNLGITIVLFALLTNRYLVDWRSGTLRDQLLVLSFITSLTLLIIFSKAFLAKKSLVIA